MITEAATNAARILIKEGYKLISVRDRILAKVPDGLSIKEALLEHELARYISLGRAKEWEPIIKGWVNSMSIEYAERYYLKACSPYRKEVSLSILKEFCRLGGKSV